MQKPNELKKEMSPHLSRKCSSSLSLGRLTRLFFESNVLPVSVEYIVLSMKDLIEA